MTQTLQPNVQGMFHKNLIMKKYLLAYVVSRQSLGMVWCVLTIKLYLKVIICTVNHCHFFLFTQYLVLTHGQWAGQDRGNTESIQQQNDFEKGWINRGLMLDQGMWDRSTRD